ncbi:MAG: zf-TFIIB domain-containing protein [Nocardioidaceae bacterium]
MEQMTCPQCQGAMLPQRRGGVQIAQCDECRGLFLDRAELATLIEQENEWHLSSGPRTEPLPRITTDMAAPPSRRTRPRSQSFIDELFG